MRARVAATALSALVMVACAPAPATTPSPSPSPSPSASASPSPSPSPTFEWASRPAEASDALTWREGCPVPLDDLIVVELDFWTFDGEVAEGELVIDAAIEAQAREAFSTLFDERFPVRSIRNIDEFGGSDDDSMAADNTSGFNCRLIAGTDQWSNHAYGRAIDVNPVENPYVYRGTAYPPASAAYVNRAEAPGMFVEGSAALQAFLDAGFFWGGNWKSPDYQHFEIAP